jgi:rod shape-determining protein MreC
VQEKYFSSKLIKFFLVLAVCGLLIFLNPKGILSPVRNIFMTLAYPFEKIFYITSKKVESTANFLSSISDLRTENERLIKENAQMEATLVSLTEEKRENESLRQQLDLLPKKKFDLEGGSIIGQDPQKLGSWLMIDKGQTEGIVQGMPVIVSDGIIVGKIGEVNINNSRIDLLSSSSSLVNAVDLDTNAKGIVRGEFGLGAILDMVAQTDVLNVGDEVITSGLGGDMPRGLLIGRIQEIRTTQDKLFQQALITPKVKYSSLETAYVIKNSK